MSICEKKWKSLAKRMAALGLIENDLKEAFTHGSSKGGQKANKTASRVVLIHTPSKMQVQNNSTRSQHDNRYFARKALCQKVEGVDSILIKKIQKQKKRARKKTIKKLDGATRETSNTI